MAKTKTVPINKIPIPNKIKIKTCKECKGKPPEEDINLPDFEGKKCSICYHPISWKKKTSK